MADYRYGERNRGSSIFSDDAREDQGRDDRSRSAERGRWHPEEHGWGGDPHRGRDRDERSRSPDDRGFFERAGDEVRSWFGDDEAERRREQDARRYEQEHGLSGRYRGGHEDQWTGRRVPDASDRRASDRPYERNQLRSNTGRSGGYSQDESGRGGGYGEGGFGGSRQSFGSSHHDDSYRRWRDQQIAQLDQEYDEYCRHRQQQFEQDFSSFRQNRQSGITSGGATLSDSGQTGSISTGQQQAGETAGTSAFAEAGEAGKSKRS